MELFDKAVDLVNDLYKTSGTAKSDTCTVVGMQSEVMSVDYVFTMHQGDENNQQ